LESELQCAVEQGDIHSQANVQLQLIELEIRAGNWPRADQLAHQNMEVIRQSDFGNGEQVMLYHRALVDAHRGRVDSARAAAEAGAAAAAAARDEWSRVGNESVLGFLELSLGNVKEAHTRLGPLIESLDKMGVGEPSIAPWLPNEIEALINLERFDEAETLLSRLEHQGQALDRPWALVTAARCRALLSAAQANSREALAWIEHALKEHKRLPHPFELARTLRVQGTILRRNRKKAAANRSLERALAIFDELGAVIWSEQTRAELRRVGLRLTSSTGTTEAEARVAELAAAGKTNKEVAATLFMSVRTVEHHLSQVYRKLGVRSRTELARKLAPPERYGSD
jgi:DNA-binding CsgD family transcriptional regulator